MRSKRVIETVARERNLRVADILGGSRSARFVAARRDAIVRMKALGLTDARIATAMCRERTTILEYRNDELRARKAARNKAKHAEARA